MLPAGSTGPPSSARGWETSGGAALVGLCGAKRLCSEETAAVVCGSKTSSLSCLVLDGDLIAASSEFPCTMWV